MKMQAVRLFVCAMMGVFGVPAGRREGTWFSPVVPAGALAPSKLVEASSLTDTFTVYQVKLRFGRHLRIHVK